MIIHSFDNKSPAIINPQVTEEAIKCDVVIVTFSNQIEEFVLNNYKTNIVGEVAYVNGKSTIYSFQYKEKIFGFYKTNVGAPACVGMLEDVIPMFNCKKVLVFGSAGTLDKSCCGKVIVPTYAYRDEGTSYHYEKPDDYIKIINSKIVSNFMEKYGIPFKAGKCWTTDAFYRETKNNLSNRQQEGCVAVDMECSAMQAVCNFRNLDLYYFFLSGDLLDAPEWNRGDLTEANHNNHNFDIALHLAYEICQ